MTWKEVHSRNRVVRDIVDRAADGPPPLSVGDLRAIEAEFAGLDDFLLQVHTLWARAVDARLDSVLGERPADKRAATGTLLDGLEHDLPGARRVLDTYADNRALAAAVARHERLLRELTGVDLSDVPVRTRTEPSRAPRCPVRRGLRAVGVSIGATR